MGSRARRDRSGSGDGSPGSYQEEESVPTSPKLACDGESYHLMFAFPRAKCGMLIGKKGTYCKQLTKKVGVEMAVKRTVKPLLMQQVKLKGLWRSADRDGRATDRDRRGRRAREAGRSPCLTVCEPAL